MDKRLPRYIFGLILAAGLITLALGSLPAQAQTGCTGDPCIFYTPTPTGTPTAVPTAGPGTPTPVPWVEPAEFPISVPRFNAPTTIPRFSYPGTPAPLQIALPTAPAPIEWATLEDPQPITAADTSAISYSNAIELDLAGNTVGDGHDVAYTLLGTAGQWPAMVVDYTDTISGFAATLEGTGTFTIASAPDWYAPALPRDMAAVGWTFEGLIAGSDFSERYSLATWSYMFASTASMPFRLAKGVFNFFRALGPFGLMVGWLFIMFPLVLFFSMLPYIKRAIMTVFHFIEWVAYWIQEIWDAIPLKMS